VVAFYVQSEISGISSLDGGRAAQIICAKNFPVRSGYCSCTGPRGKMAAEVDVDLGLLFKIDYFIFTLGGLAAVVGIFNELGILFLLYDGVPANVDGLGVLFSSLFLFCQVHNRF
jgi:hypothetical protein